jgi:hypothetical protein
VTLSARELPRQQSNGVGQETPKAATQVSAAEAAKSLAGLWKAPEYRAERYSELDVQVFGPHAFDLRNVDLTIQPSGDGLLQVYTSVIDQKGRKYSPSVIEAKLRIGAPQTTYGGRIQPDVTVVSAEEKYLDKSGDRWPRDGSRVQLTMSDLGSDEMNFRFDTKDGRGSFGTTLRRQRPRGR